MKEIFSKMMRSEGFKNTVTQELHEEITDDSYEGDNLNNYEFTKNIDASSLVDISLMADISLIEAWDTRYSNYSYNQL